MVVKYNFLGRQFFKTEQLRSSLLLLTYICPYKHDRHSVKAVFFLGMIVPSCANIAHVW